MSEIYDPRFEQPLPDNKADLPERFATDLAIGVYNGYWPNDFAIQGMKGWGFNVSTQMNPQALLTYLKNVWASDPPIEHLLDQRLLKKTRSWGDDISYYELTKEALDYGKKSKVFPGFISYRRCESSALALLLISRMAARKTTVYLDQHPDPEFPRNRIGLGEDWEPELKRAVLASTVIIFLIGPKTLEVESFAHKEIGWALNASPEKKIIPILHNGFKRSDLAQHEDHTDPRVITLIKNKNGIEVSTEDPDGYNTAIERLLTDLNIQA